METPKMREAILSKARQEAQILIDEAKSKAGEVVGKAQEQWERRLEAEKKRLLSESRRGAARIIAQADLKARQEILKEKDSIIREMIGKVKERLTENTSETSTLERLITDGRIHPARIEEVVQKITKEITQVIYEEGEKVLFELGLHNFSADGIRALGRLHFRTSYGQNVLSHSKEVAILA
ncbi:MAG TPA: ribonuclease Y, partial [Deltaproteobacteria bacterium]|nr:ribonuclease Y [Deltaproteobacteria bacterium]